MGTQRAAVAAVTDMCGSNWIQRAPRPRASAWRHTPMTPPLTSPLLPNDSTYVVSGMSGATVKARCQNSP